MIETDYFILDGKQYQQFYTEAQELGVTVDYYLMEFMFVTGPMVEHNGEEWVEIDDTSETVH